MLIEKHARFQSELKCYVPWDYVREAVGFPGRYEANEGK